MGFVGATEGSNRLKELASAAFLLSRMNPVFAAAQDKPLVSNKVGWTVPSLRVRFKQPRFRPCGPTEVFA